MRAPYYAYHTDRDTPARVSAAKFEDTILIIQEIIYILENNSILKRKFYGLPHLNSDKYKINNDTDIIGEFNFKLDAEQLNH